MDYITARLGSEGSPMLAFGGDYNPEQWPEETWDEDVRLMREAGVNLVSVGIFSWSLLEPSEGVYEFGWLDRVLDLLHANGIRVDLANATASPPPWFSHKYPESLPGNAPTACGTATVPGRPSRPRARLPPSRRGPDRADRRPVQGPPRRGRCGTSHNEYGCHNQHCFSDGAAAGFRRWLRARYGSLDGAQRRLGHRLLVPALLGLGARSCRRATSGTWVNPTQQLDFARFSSDELLECYKAEAAIIRTHSGHPVTTNFMGQHGPAPAAWTTGAGPKRWTWSPTTTT